MDSDEMNNGRDDVDKWPFNKLKFKKKERATDHKPMETKETADACYNVVPVIDQDADSDEYLITQPLGMCLIFSHQYFDKCPERKGTKKDATCLYTTFRKLGFDEVRLFDDKDDLTVTGVLEKLRKAAEADHPKNSCFVCCILTHGDTGVLCARDGIYPVHLLYEIFNGSKASSTLRGIPKLFFIQACQGEDGMSGEYVNYQKPKVKESMDNIIKIPTYADFLIMYSSFPGFVAFKNEIIGSYFIKNLCEVLTEHSENKHLMDMLTIVTRKVAFYFQSSNYKDASKDKKKQVPYTTSTLTKYVKFPPKLS